MSFQTSITLLCGLGAFYMVPALAGSASNLLVKDPLKRGGALLEVFLCQRMKAETTVRGYPIRKRNDCNCDHTENIFRMSFVMAS